MQSMHWDTERKCEHCMFATIHKVEFEDHMKSMHLRIITECQKCDYFTPDFSRLCMHMRSLHAGTVKCCGSCYFASFDEVGMVQHLESKHADESGKIESHDKRGKANGGIKEEDGQVRCKMCSFSSSEAELTEHIVKFHVIC